MSSTALKNKVENRDQQPPKPFSIFNDNRIEITLELPAALQINQNRQESFTTAPILHNSTAFDIAGGTFSINLNDVKDASSNVIANVRWWDASTYDGQQEMTFEIPTVAAGHQAVCKPQSPAYTSVRWNATVSSGRATEVFTNSVKVINLTYSPADSKIPASGPIVQVG
ncbi:hypothetical protein N5D48_04990 [Pseudomonas sp. GD03858]|uniref:hypothetical protein n=1 Tax=unclassified Pseudomonas TaxID=196821 RepID=UPI00244B62E6|nr:MULTISPECIES: hypothetical protein [unclassified Pseudomonas]MDH0646252.1 hypothetical protein [Pseudomonas sp. GD03867]MDH0661749.1 hypothetical protein [Pseudomonas sp. GD03858]